MFSCCSSPLEMGPIEEEVEAAVDAAQVPLTPDGGFVRDGRFYHLGQLTEERLEAARAIGESVKGAGIYGGHAPAAVDTEALDRPCSAPGACELRDPCTVHDPEAATVDAQRGGADDQLTSELTPREHEELAGVDELQLLDDAAAIDAYRRRDLSDAGARELEATRLEEAGLELARRRDDAWEDDAECERAAARPAAGEDTGPSVDATTLADSVDIGLAGGVGDPGDDDRRRSSMGHSPMA